MSSAEALALAILVWLRVAPKRVWRDVERFELLAKAKRHDRSEAPDPQRTLADYIAERFRQADWEVSHPEPQVPDRTPGPPKD